MTIIQSGNRVRKRSHKVDGAERGRMKGDVGGRRGGVKHGMFFVTLIEVCLYLSVVVFFFIALLICHCVCVTGSSLWHVDLTQCEPRVKG